MSTLAASAEQAKQARRPTPGGGEPPSSQLTAPPNSASSFFGNPIDRGADAVGPKLRLNPARLDLPPRRRTATAGDRKRGSDDHATCAVGDLMGDGRMHLVTGNFYVTNPPPRAAAIGIWQNVTPGKAKE
jgi:hypothetical protein